MKKVILAIDLGTTSIKLAACTPSGEKVASLSKKTETYFLEEGGVEQDPEQWWSLIKEGIQELLAHPDVDPFHIIAFVCTAQWSGIVPLDKKGIPCCNALIWMDSRGAEQTKNLIKGFPQVKGYSLRKLTQWLRISGGAPGKSGKDSIAHILYLKEKRPEIYQRTYKFLEPKDYLNYKLTNLFSSSYDSICLHWLTNNRRLNHIHYDPQLIKMSGLDPLKLPELHPSTAILGPIQPSLAKELQISLDVPVIASSPDVHTAAVGSGAVDLFAPHLYIGTSSWISAHVPFKKTDIQTNITSIPSALPDRFLIACAQETAGACLDFYKNQLFKNNSQEESSFENLEKAAKEAPPGSHKVIFTPWLSGERTPVENHLIRGGFHNISMYNNKSDMARSVYEGVAFNSKWMLNAVEKFCNQKLDPIHFIGGGALSELWCQIHADILNRTILQMEDPQYANIRGAVWIASLALNLVDAKDIPQLVKVRKVFRPNPKTHELYNQHFNEFISIYKMNKHIHNRLNS